MTIAINKVDGCGLSNIVHCEYLEEDKKLH